MERKDPFILPQLTILESEAYQTFLLDKRTGSRRAMTYLSYFEDSRTKKLLYEQSSWQLNLVVHTRVTGLCVPCGKERRTIRTKQMV